MGKSEYFSQAFIVHYRDDPDQQNLIDWIQEGWLQCCGIEGPTVSLIFKNLILKIQKKCFPSWMLGYVNTLN